MKSSMCRNQSRKFNLIRASQPMDRASNHQFAHAPGIIVHPSHSFARRQLNNNRIHYYVSFSRMKLEFSSVSLNEFQFG